MFSTQVLASTEPTELLQRNCSGTQNWSSHYPSQGTLVASHTAPQIEPALSNKVHQQLLATSPAWSPTSFSTPSQPELCCLQEALPNLLSRQADLSLPASRHEFVSLSGRLGARVGRLQLIQFWPRAKPCAFPSEVANDCHEPQAHLPLGLYSLSIIEKPGLDRGWQIHRTCTTIYVPMFMINLAGQCLLTAWTQLHNHSQHSVLSSHH